MFKLSRKILSVILFFISTSCLAQPYHREIDKIPVEAGGVSVHQPFDGGVNTPIIRFVDIDSDNDQDLFVFDNDLSVGFYRNIGTANAPEFKLQPNQIILPRFQTWFLFIDLSGDGKTDLLTDNSSSGVSFYRNDGTMQVPNFVLQDSTMRDSAGYPVFGGFSSVPACVDIDGDGKIDFISGNAVNGSINFYKNIGTTTSPLFTLMTQEFSNITIIGDTCYQTFSKLSHLMDPMHGASVFFFADIDANGTQDFFYGDINSPGVFFMNNSGTPTSPHLQCGTNRYPFGSPVMTTGFNVPALVDIDGDGDLDFFVGRSFGPIVGREGFWFMENVGDSAHPFFTLLSKEYISTIDVGMNASPVLVDIDSDGDLDVFVGSLDGSLSFFRNDGTRSHPSFILADSLYSGISGNFSYAPAFVDIDNDGDKDLFIGRFDGHIKYYKNIGSTTVPQFVSAASPVDTVFVHQNASPAFADIDGDGDQDLFIGTSDGKISFYRNAGDSANFIPQFVSGDFDTISVGNDAKPFFIDIDNDGDADVFVGNTDGVIFFYENTGARTSAQFVLRTMHYANTDPLKESAPAFGDIDGDGDLDVFVGTSKGGIHFYRNDVIDGVVEAKELPHEIYLSQNYPNPFNPVTNFGFRLTNSGFVSVKVFDELGREVVTLINQSLFPGEYSLNWNALDFPSGVYYYRVSSSSVNSVKRMILIK